MMSASSQRWMSIAFSGVSRWRDPSMWDWKVTPSGVIRASLASENTWNPPLSVRMGARPAHEAVQTAEAADHLLAGPQVEVVGVAEDDLRADGGEVLRRQRLDRAERPHGHEHGRFHRAVRGVHDAGAGAGPAAAMGDVEVEHRLVFSVWCLVFGLWVDPSRRMRIVDPFARWGLGIASLDPSTPLLNQHRVPVAEEPIPGRTASR